jgi:tetratricopeptide (TPR) repeat protein
VAIGDGMRARRLAERAHARYGAAGWAAAEATIADGPERLAPEAWAQLGVALENDERRDDARRALLRSRALAPERTDTLLFLAELERDAGKDDAAIEHYRVLLAAAPGAAGQALDLARLLAAREAHAEVAEVLLPFRDHVSVELRVALARALFETERHAEVVEVVAPLIKDTERELGGFVSGNLRGELIGRLREATELHDDAYAILHGREKVIEAEVHRGRLLANAGVNYRLLGQARMVAAPSWTPDTALRDVEGTAAFGQALIAAGERSRGLCHLGVAALRRHASSDARDLFEQARELDDDNFAAFLGIGAALDHDRTRAVARVARLPEAPTALPAAIAPVFVDWPALTTAERTCVHAALVPLERPLRDVAAAGAIARVLPIDARVVDLPELGAHAGVRHADSRCLDAVGGAANDRVCASKVEELLIFSGQRSWVFAHELAHLVHHQLSDDLCRELEELFAELDAGEFLLTSYQSRNVREFFAVAYEDYLCNLYALPSPHQATVEHLEPVFAFIDRLTGGG